MVNLVDEVGWKTVRRPKPSTLRRRWDNERKDRFFKRAQRNNILFITSFLEELGVNDIYEEFKGYGDIDEVVITLK